MIVLEKDEYATTSDSDSNSNSGSGNNILRLGMLVMLRSVQLCKEFIMVTRHSLSTQVADNTIEQEKENIFPNLLNMNYPSPYTL